MILKVPKNQYSEELKYVANYIFVERLGFDEIEIELSEMSNYTLFESDGEELRLPSSKLFSNIDAYVQNQLQPKVAGEGKFWEMFVAEEDGVFDLHFDIFAAVFYLLARVDEFKPNAQFDKHGRFTVESSIQYKYGVHELPIIDFWLLRIKEVLAAKGIEFSNNERFQWWNTIDIDQVYAIKGKPLHIQIGLVVKKISNAKFGEAAILLKALFGDKDPFDVLENVYSTKSRDILFFLCSGKSIYDNPKSRNEKSIINLISNWKQRFEIGLHPSYDTYLDKALLEKEKRLAETWTQRPVSFTRQHYLHYKWPQTPKRLSELEFEQDFTMGYANGIGYRAGTSRPFYFFDLKERKAHSLRIVPFGVMDVTLRFYLNLNPKEAYNKIQLLVSDLKECNGLFCSLWHNESLSEIDGWKGWKWLFLQMKEDLSK